MTQTVAVIPWEQTPGKGRVYATAIDALIDANWEFKIEGTDASGGSDIKYTATHVVIDNLSNNALVTFQYGPFVFRVSPYTRKTFPILNGSTSVLFMVTTGVVNLIFATFDPRVPDDTNSVDSTSAGSATVVYQHKQFSNGDAPLKVMVPGDNGYMIEFANTIALTYELADPSTVTNFYSPMIYAFPYSIGVTIDRGVGAFLWDNGANVASLSLAPGEAAMLSSDGVSWWLNRYA